MNAQTPTFEVAPADPSGERVRRHAEVLEELAELGMVMARMMRGQVSEALKHHERVDVATMSTAFGRVSRSVRQCLALEDKLAEHHATRGERIRKALERGEVAGDRIGSPVSGSDSYGLEGLPPMGIATRKAAVVKAVADIVRADVLEREGVEREDDRLFDDLYERAGEFDDLDFATRPVGEIAGMICDDLQVMVDWKHWRASDWAAAELREHDPRSPFFRAEAAGEAGTSRTPVRDRGPP